MWFIISIVIVICLAVVLKNKRIRCKECDGTGELPANGGEPVTFCGVCNGKGWL